MSWTDERVEILKKLWMEGLSASQIAGELGQGVTRNAVIGKVHRLKLSGRAKPATSAARSRPANRTPRRSSASGGGSSSAGSTKRRSSINSAPMMGATALKQSEDAEADLYVAPSQMEEIFIPEAERIGLLSLSEDTCKWPIGDPLNPDFYFCGQHSEEGKPYCEFHSRRAYHTLDRKKK